MTFVLRMAGRELRASWRRLAFFFLCVAVGVGAIVALRSVIQSVGAAMTAETRALTAADILITSEQPWSDEARAVIDEALASEPDLARTSSIETATMARPADETKTVAKVVELRGVEAAFPFYGEFVLQGAVPYRHDLLAGGGALVRPELLTQLDVTVGEEIIIGEGTFEIRGVILREAGGQLGAFSFGPRV
ncbi:MAG: ABC transporter permease, partial [Vicinamibacterales bacterium]|nr:ABC transporter permease [Vicinamibacterales bacterium]